MSAQHVQIEKTRGNIIEILVVSVGLQAIKLAWSSATLLLLLNALNLLGLDLQLVNLQQLIALVVAAYFSSLTSLFKHPYFIAADLLTFLAALAAAPGDRVLRLIVLVKIVFAILVVIHSWWRQRTPAVLEAEDAGGADVH